MTGQVLPGVPASITRKQYTALVEGAGFNVSDLRSLEFQHDGIYAEVYAQDPTREPGWRYTIDGENVATHRVCIKVVDEAVDPS